MFPVSVLWCLPAECLWPCCGAAGLLVGLRLVYCDVPALMAFSALLMHLTQGFHV